jgi:hypothetical protein
MATDPSLHIQSIICQNAEEITNTYTYIYLYVYVYVYLYRTYTVGAVSITNAKSITNGGFAAIFTVKKIFFRLYFLIINFKEFYKRNKKKKFEIFVLIVKKT